MCNLYNAATFEAMRQLFLPIHDLTNRLTPQMDVYLDNPAHVETSPRGRFNKLALACLFGLISFDAQAQTASLKEEPTKQMLEQCIAVKTLSPAYCQCVIAVSESLTDNRQLFRAYVAATANNDEKAKALYNEMIDSPDLDKHNFSSKQEKTDYVEGKARVFEHRLTTLCADIE